MSNRIKNRSGVTILEVTITIVILLVIAALLLPAVRHSGEAARRSQCQNNLKQIGLSLMNYHDAHKTFPPGWIASEAKGQSSGFGWQFQILPFFDQAPLFKQFDSEQNLADQESQNASLAETIIPASRCPSDSGPDQADSRSIPLIGTTNYVGNFGVGIPSTYSARKRFAGELIDPRYVQGMFGPNSKIRIRDVKDGMSNVVMVGERRLSKDGTEWPIENVEGNFNSYWSGIPDIDTVSPLTVVATATGGLIEHCEQGELLYPIGNLKPVENATERQALPFFGINRSQRELPLQGSDGNTQVTAGFSSWHTGGCHVVLGDGVVRFLSEEIDPVIFVNLVRRSDSQMGCEF